MTRSNPFGGSNLGGAPFLMGFGCDDPNCPCGGIGAPEGLEAILGQLFGLSGQQRGAAGQTTIPMVRAVSGRYIGGPGLGGIPADAINEIDQQMTAQGFPITVPGFLVIPQVMSPKEALPLSKQFHAEVERLQGIEADNKAAQRFIQQFVQMGGPSTANIVLTLTEGEQSGAKLLYQLLGVIKKGALKGSSKVRKDLTKSLPLPLAGEILVRMGGNTALMREVEAAVLRDQIEFNRQNTQEQPASSRVRPSVRTPESSGSPNGRPAPARC